MAEKMYDEKKNIVTIKVVCCNPEKIRDKLCCKGCGSIKSIEIVEPPPPPEPEKPREKTPPPPTPPTLGVPPPYQRRREYPTGQPGQPPTPPPPPPPTQQLRVMPPCYDGLFGRPVYDGYYGRPVYDSYGGGRPCYVSRCDEYFWEDNTSSCSVM